MGIKERVIEIISDQLGLKPETIKETDSLTDDLGADSLDLIEITMFLEDDFGTEIPDEDAEKLRTVKEVIEYIERIKCP